MLANGDLGAIDQIPGSAGDMILVFENTTFFNVQQQSDTARRVCFRVQQPRGIERWRGSSGGPSDEVHFGRLRQRTAYDQAAARM
jgi:hypothetical protein